MKSWGATVGDGTDGATDWELAEGGVGVGGL